jgi:hypothetical protein
VADVLLDGVKFQFPDPPPASISEVRAALEEMLAARGRVLAGLWIDRQPFDESLGASPLPPGGRIEATSLTLAEAIAQAGAALAPEFAALQSEVDALANTVVRVPWSEVHEQCLRLVENAAQSMQRAVDVVAHSGEGSAAAAAVTALAEAMERWMNGVQQRDAAAVCLVLDDAVGPALQRLGAVLREKPAA